MSYTESLDNKRIEDKIWIVCDVCKKPMHMMVKNAKINQNKNNGKHMCFSCICKNRVLPQNTKEFWENPEQKLNHSKILKSSKKFQEANRKIDKYGEKNGMFGKEHSVETKLKMSIVRKGKCGKNATAWKGGKSSLIQILKKYIHRNYKWYLMVFKRDGFKCVNCGSKENLDAHHIVPFNKLVKDLIVQLNLGDKEKYEIFKIIKDEKILVDNELKNGITLCRKCHRETHSKQWGSHNCK
jgi:hypothetical protein